MPTGSASHFDLVTRGHRFILEVLPLRELESQSALAGFVHYVTACELTPALVDAVLVRCLAILDRHSGGRLPTLVERYVSRPGLNDCAARFRTIVEDLLKYHRIGNPLVARAVAKIDERFAETDLEATLANEEHVTLRQLCDAFKNATGVTTNEFIKSARLSQAARLLLETHESKIALKVGYGSSSAANFIHDFRHRFGMTPGEYRKRALPSTLNSLVPPHGPSSLSEPKSTQPRGRCPVRVLIVDDDSKCLDTTATFLRMNECTVVTALTGEDGLREAASVTPDVVLLDYHLGDGMNGIEFLGTLRRQRHAQQPAAVLLTADWDVEDNDVREFEAFIVRKLCDLDQILAVVDYLSPARTRSATGF